MAQSLVQVVQQHLAYTHLERESPNVQSISGQKSSCHPEKLDQACISAVLAGIYQFTREEDDANKLMNPKLRPTWLEVVFWQYPMKLQSKIAAYTGCQVHLIRQRLYAVAEKAVMEIRQTVGPKGTGKDIKSYLTSQRMSILSRLPSGLEVGNLVHNNSLDDATNKMHGPFSDFMHWIETYLAEPQRPLY